MGRSRRISGQIDDDNEGASHPSITGDVEDNLTSQKVTSRKTIGNTTRADATESQDEGEHYDSAQIKEDQTWRETQSVGLWINEGARASDFEAKDDDETERTNFPPDCYSFLSLHGPIDDIQFFSFGMMVFIFQFLFLLLIVMSVLDQKWRNDGDVDNPGNDIFASFIAANASPLVRATQILAVLCYVIFADSSLMDVVTAVETYPWHAKEATKCMIFSCILRFTQGAMASVAALLTIITSETVIDIVLNFTALNFISQLDDVAFELALDGRYGRKLEAEAKRITELEMPHCLSKGNKRRRYYGVLLSVAFCLLSLLITLISFQESKNLWLTKVLRVEFQDKSLMVYSGCYEMNKTASIIGDWDKRNIYTITNASLDNTHIGYCVHTHQWMLFKDAIDACSADDGTLAYSAKTPAFDVSTTFDGGWYSASGTPLDLYFIELDQQLESECSSFDDGICNDFFNNFTFQYDGGDCCSATCSHPNCGIDGLTEAFGTANATGKGFPKCKDPTMVPLTIHLDNFTSSRTPSNMIQRFGEEEIEKLLMMQNEKYWGYNPVSASLSLLCDDKSVLVLSIDERMSNQTETVFVNDRATCTIKVANRTVLHESVFDPPIWYFDITISPGRSTDTRNAKILEMNTGQQGLSSFDILSIPECMFKKLSNYTNMTTIYIDNSHSLEAVKWMIAESVDCFDKYLIDKFALSVLNLGAPAVGGKDSMWIESNPPCVWAVTECNDGATLSSLKLSQLALTGTISTTLGLLTSLSTLMIDGNSLHGKIPSEIGLLSSLETLKFGHNNLTNVIPSEIGLLSFLQFLMLDANDLSGAIPCEVGQLTSSKQLLLSNNNLTGTLCSEIGLLTSLTVLRLEENDFSGKIFSEIGMLTNLTHLRFDGNSLTGKLPSEIGLLSSLEVLRLDENSLTGEIPSEIGTLSSLSRLIAYETGLRGTMPSEIGLLSSIESLKMGKDDLTGELPSEIGQFLAPKIIVIVDTNMTGAIPSQIGLLSSLESLHLNGNKFEGNLPSEIGLLQALHDLEMGQNSLTGTIPIEVYFLSSLHHFNLSNNGFDGEIPPEVQFLNSSIETLDLANNSLRGAIPSEIGSLSPLEKLDLANNILAGEIPSELGLLSSLEKLALDGNRLQGEIPSDIGRLQSLTTLMLQSNQLNSTIPTTLGNLTNVMVIDLGNNDLTGSIPTEIGMMANARHLSLASNALKGLLPTEIGLLTQLTHLSIGQNNDFSGLIPSELGLLSNLECLDLDQDIFETPIPKGVSDLLQTSTCATRVSVL